MAKKKDSPVVYVPLNNSSSYQAQNIINEQLKDIPPYEDTGVKFKGKFKVDKGNNTYELKGQVRFIYDDSALNTLAQQILYAVPQGYKIFIDKIIVSVRAGSDALGCRVFFYDGTYSADKIRLRLNVPVDFCQSFDFLTPLEFTNSINWNMGSANSDGQVIVYGWVEPI